MRPVIVALRSASLVCALAAASSAASQEQSTLIIKEIIFSGNTLVESSVLAEQTSAFLGRALTLEDFDGITSSVGFAYRDLGFWAAGYLPEQSILDGVLTVGVVEARVGDLSVALDTKRSKITETDIEKILLSDQFRGDFLRMDRLEDRIKDANEIAGINVTANLSAGDEEQETDISAVVTDSTLVSGSAVIDNFVGTGNEPRFSGRVGLDSPLGYGEQFELSSQVSKQSFSIDFASSLSVNQYAQKLQFEIGYASYDLGGELAALGLTGHSRKAELSLQNVNFGNDVVWRAQGQFFLSHNVSDDYIQGSLSTTKRSTMLGAQFNFSSPANRNRESSFEGEISGVVGNLDLGFGSTAYTQDQLTRRSHGPFSKLQLSFQAEAPLQNETILTWELRSQLANRNLDGSQKFVIAGPSAMRSLSMGELTADDGVISRLNLATSFDQEMRANAFLEGALGVQNHTLWTGWNSNDPTLRNVFSVLGLGVGLNIPLEKSTALELSAAIPVHSNLSSIQKSPRLWAQFSVNF